MYYVLQHRMPKPAQTLDNFTPFFGCAFDDFNLAYSTLITLRCFSDHVASTTHDLDHVPTFYDCLPNTTELNGFVAENTPEGSDYSLYFMSADKLSKGGAVAQVMDGEPTTHDVQSLINQTKELTGLGNLKYLKLLSWRVLDHYMDPNNIIGLK